MKSQVISKNRATGEEKIVGNFTDIETAENAAIRYTLAESNPRIIYSVR